MALALFGLSLWLFGFVEEWGLRCGWLRRGFLIALARSMADCGTLATGPVVLLTSSSVELLF